MSLVLISFDVEGFPEEFIALYFVYCHSCRFFTQLTLVDVEWEVLYTTQVTQKAKKYHDGFLRLSIQGSFGRQVDF